MNTLNQWAEEREDTEQRSFHLKGQRTFREEQSWDGQGKKANQSDFSSFPVPELQVSPPRNN